MNLTTPSQATHATAPVATNFQSAPVRRGRQRVSAWRAALPVALALVLGLAVTGCETYKAAIRPTYIETMVLDSDAPAEAHVAVKVQDARQDPDMVGVYLQGETMAVKLTGSNYRFDFAAVEPGLAAAVARAGYTYDPASPTVLTVNVRRTGIDLLSVPKGKGTTRPHYIVLADVLVMQGDETLAMTPVQGDFYGRYIQLALRPQGQGRVDAVFFDTNEKKVIENDYSVAVSAMIEKTLNNSRIRAAIRHGQLDPAYEIPAEPVPEPAPEAVVAPPRVVPVDPNDPDADVAIPDRPTNRLMPIVTPPVKSDAAKTDAAAADDLLSTPKN